MNDQNENQAATQFDELQDRLLDVALTELVGGKSPSDLSARITAAFEASRPSPAMQATSPRQAHPFRWFAAAIAAVLLVGVTILLQQTESQSPKAAKSMAKADRVGGESKNISGPGSAVASNNWRDAANGSKSQLSQLNSQTKAKLSKSLNGQINDSAAKPTILSIDGSVPAQNEPASASASAPMAESAPQPQELGPGVTRVAPMVSVPLTSRDRYGALDAKPGLANAVRQLQTALDVSRESRGPEGHARNAGDEETTRLVNEIRDLQSQGKPTDKLVAALKRRVEKSADPESRSDQYANNGLTMLVTPRVIIQEGEEERLSIEVPGFTKATSDLGSGPQSSGDRYVPIVENPFIKASGGAAVSTFSIDVDTASYTNVRQFLLQMNQLPPPDAVRIEELVNYFQYDYSPPTPAAPGSAGGSSDDAPFAAHVEVAGCPWNTEHRLARIAVKGREMDGDKRPQSNLVFLVDVSGSMNEPAKLPLVVYGLQQLTKELGENDHIAIVVYAGSEGLALPSTSGSKQDAILAVLEKLQAGGSTAGGAGIQLAYKIAEDSFIKGGTNRVILCTDGDFNVGVTSTAELQRMVEQKAKDTGVFLSVLGFGRGNLNDAMMEAIADHGNGSYHYVDNRTEARRVLVDEMAGTLVTIAKDVKIQVEFNPAQVAAYRLIGYENRMLRTEDFNDDKKDAGEIGAGHTVTALYEVVPAGKSAGVPPVDELKYQKQPGWLGSNEASPQTRNAPGGSASPRPQPPDAERTADDRTDKSVRPTEDAASNELLTLKMRYKAPDGDTSKKLEWPVTDKGASFGEATDDFQFAAAVAGFGLLLRDSQYKGNLSFAADLELAQSGLGRDEHGYRAEFLDMVRAAKKLKGE